MRPAQNFGMKEVLELVLHPRVPWLGVEALGPEVLADVGAAQLERYQVIDLVTAAAAIEAVFDIDLML